METFEEGFVVSEYVKLFSKKRVGRLNGNPGMWEWGALKLLGRRSPQVIYLFVFLGGGWEGETAVVVRLNGA